MTETELGDPLDLDEDTLDDETEAERAAREELEVDLDEESQAFVDFLVDKLMTVAERLSGHTWFNYQRPFAMRILESLIIEDGSTLTALYCRQCIDGDTIVFRRDGTATRIRNHEDAVRTGVMPVKRYRLQGGYELVMTDEHPVIQQDEFDGSWTAAGMLSPGDKISVLSGMNQWAGRKEIDRVIETGRHKTARRVQFPVSDSLARFLGYFATDGSLRPGQSAKFTNTRDQYLQEVRDLSAELFGIIPKEYAKDSGIDLLFTTSKSSYDNLLLDVMHAVEWDHGFPLDIFSWTPDQASEFINRAWSGDGCVYMKKSGPDIFLACGNDEIYARYWQSLLLKFGITSMVKREQMPKGTGTFHRLVLGNGARNIKRFFQVVGLVYGKEDKCNEAIDYFVTKALLPSGKGRAEREMFKYAGNGQDEEELVWAKVLSIEEMGEQEVFDMPVPDKKWYIANGVQVSNSGKSESVANCIATVMIMLPVLAKIYPFWLERFSEGVWVGAFAPVDEQADTLFARITGVLESDAAAEVLADPDIQGRIVGKGRMKGVKFRGIRHGSEVRKTTCHPRATIEGRTYHIILLDEAQGAADQVVNKCVAAGTKIWTPSGPQLIEDVVRNRELVLTYNGGRGIAEDLTYGKPVGFIDNGVAPTWRVSMASGRTIDATAEHQWVVRERRGSRQPHTATTLDLVQGMSVPVPLDAGFFGAYGDHDEGYLTGQLLGDGSLTGTSVKWCGMNDTAFAEMDRITQAYGDRISVWNTQESGLHEVGLVGGNLLTWAKSTGIWGFTGKDKHLPRTDYSPDFSIGFIEGLIDSDGCVSGKEVVIATVSESLMRAAQDILLQLGVQSRLSSRKNSGSFCAEPLPLWVLQIKDRNSILRLRNLVKLKADNNKGISKDHKLTEAASFHAARNSRRSSSDEKRGYPGAIAWDRIVSVEYAGEQHTYCVTVPGSHLVVWNGIVGSNSISPMGAATGATMIFTGTCNYTKNVFYNQIQINKREATKRGKKRQNHFEVDWRTVARENKRYGRYVKQTMVRIGEDCDEFKLSYRLIWLLDKGMFTTHEKLDQCGDSTMHLVPAWTKTPLVVGIDPARIQDKTVVTVVWVDWDHPDDLGYYHHRVLNWLDLEGLDWEVQYYKIVEFLSNYNIWKIGVDSGGVGDAVAQRLQLLMPSVEVVPLGSASTEQSVRWKYLRDLIDRQQVVWPAHSKVRRLKTWKRFRQEMEDLEVSFKGPNMQAEAPNMRDAHDDYADSLAMACILSKDYEESTVETGSNPFYGNHGVMY